MSEVKINIGGSELKSTQYGSDYSSEFRRILQTYVPLSARNYLEWGAGYTTKMMVEHIGQSGADMFVTIDNNASYLGDVVKDIKCSYINPVSISIDGPCLNDRDKGYNYSSYPLSLNRKFDFIFIDGRRRVECSFVASLLCHDETIVVMHDYRRERYQSVRALYNVVEDGVQFRVMKRRRNIGDNMNFSYELVQAILS
nr:hypothetical protein [Brevundimonas diminuta]